MITVRAQRRRRREAGLSVIETLIIVCICAALALLSMMWVHNRQARRVRCTSGLRQISVAMEVYLEKYGDESEGADLPDLPDFANPDAGVLLVPNTVPSRADNVKPEDTGER